MLYKLIINYVRLQLLQMFLQQIRSSKFAKTKNIKTINLLTYGLELFATFYFDGKRNKGKSGSPGK